MVELQTRQIQDVPIGGVFIAYNNEVCMGFRPRDFDVYIKSEEPDTFIELSGWELSDPDDFSTVSVAEVAYTGVVLLLRKEKEHDD